jgi:hypothetical protein
MQVVKKALLYFLVILFSLAVFAPKRELYYLLEAYLMRQDIVIDNEEIKSGLFSLELEHPVFYVKGIKIAQVEKISLFTLFFYTSINAKEVKVDDSLKQWVPGKIKTVKLYYQLADPRRISIKVSGFFGKAKGYLELGLKQRKLYLGLTKADSIGSLAPLLKKGEKGWYYETSF